MNIRLQITFFLILTSLIGVIGSAFFILQTATIDKKNYVTELNSVLSPQIKDSIDQKIRTLLFDLKDFSEIIENSQNTHEAKYLETLKTRLKNADAILISTKTNTLIAISLNNRQIPEEDLNSLSTLVNATNPDTLSREHLIYFRSNLYLFKTAGGRIGAVSLNSDFFKDPFELARGKKSLLISANNQILYTNKDPGEDVTLISGLPTTGVKGSELFTFELKDDKGHQVLANYSKINSIKDSFVLIITPQVTWQDLVSPLLKSSLSLILILILFSVITAYYISRSLAKPIELLAEETSKIGIGEWKKITRIHSKNEVAKLSKAFNRMISNLINRENELKIAHNKIIQSESLAAIGRIGAGIAHEVKNPLSSILGYCQLIDINLKTLQNDTAAVQFSEKLEKFKNYNKLVIDDTRRANKIISDLLTFSRQKEILVEKTNLHGFVSGTESKFKALCEANSIGFSAEYHIDKTSLYVKIDAEQIYQVLFNLMQNAVHALNSSEKNQKLIQLVCESTEESVSIDILDNGPGISTENLKKIFEPFFSTKKVGEGSGLGLAICYGIVLQHNGQILVESVAEQRTCFKVKLPLLK